MKTKWVGHGLGSGLVPALFLGVLAGWACDKAGVTPVVAPPVSTAVEGKEAPSLVHLEERAPAPHEPAPHEEVGPVVVLAESPRMDLLHNRYRWHLYGDGLVIPLASEGLRKYTQEYNRPWGPVVEHEGRAGRVLTRSSAVLRVPWDGEPGSDDMGADDTSEDDTGVSHTGVTARVYLHGGVRGQRVQINVNGRRAGVVNASPEWGHVDIKIPEGMLVKGENEVRLTLSARTRMGGEQTYGLFHAIEFGTSFGEDAVYPGLSPVVGGAEGEFAIGGFDRLAMYLEIPDDAWFSFTPVGEEGEVVIRTMEGERIVVESVSRAMDGGERVVDLTDFASQIVVLELHGRGVLWSHPFIGLSEAEVRPAPEPYENVILLVVDTLRSDRLALYGETRVQTPRFTEAGKDAVVFLNNQAPSPSSPPSHASIQTGMIPRVHGVTGDSGRLEPNTPLISSQLAAAGISTAYVGNNSFGMTRLRAAGNWAAFHSPVQEGLGIDCTALVSEVMRVARAKREAGDRFFISALPWEPHAPYRFHEGITEKYYEGPWTPPVGKFADGYLLIDIMAGRKRMNDQQWTQLFALYDGEIEYMDRCFGTLLDALEAEGLKEKTAIVLTSDHGEGMNERGRLGHAYGHYTELADVPFVVFAPGLLGDGEGPRRIANPTSCIDIAPTVLALMGVDPSEKVQGANVLPMALRQGSWVPRVVSSEYGRSYGLKARDWRLVVQYDGREELYDGVKDRAEQHNVIGEDLLAVRYMREMAGFFIEHRSQWKKATWGTLANHEAGFVESVTRAGAL